MAGVAENFGTPRCVEGLACIPVWPSGAAWVTKAVEMVPPAPARLSAITGRPRPPDRICACSGPAMSATPPGGKSTTRRIGRFGQAPVPCAIAGRQNNVAAARAGSKRREIIAWSHRTRGIGWDWRVRSEPPWKTPPSWQVVPMAAGQRVPPGFIIEAVSCKTRNGPPKPDRRPSIVRHPPHAGLSLRAASATPAPSPMPRPAHTPSKGTRSSTFSAVEV